VPKILGDMENLKVLDLAKNPLWIWEKIWFHANPRWGYGIY